MATDSVTLHIKAHGEFGDMRQDLIRIVKEMDFSMVVLEGINAMQQAQRTLAPVGKTGRGPHGNIPRSIKPSRIYRRQDGSAWAYSRTNYGPAIFTSEGTGEWGPRQRPYFVAVGEQSTANKLNRDKGYYHPGQRGTNWFVAGAQMGERVGLLAFERKVEQMLRVRG